MLLVLLLAMNQNLTFFHFRSMGGFPLALLEGFTSKLVLHRQVYFFLVFLFLINIFISPFRHFAISKKSSVRFRFIPLTVGHLLGRNPHGKIRRRGESKGIPFFSPLTLRGK